MDFLNFVAANCRVAYYRRVPQFRKNKVGPTLLLAWAVFFFALPALIGICRSEAKMGPACCGSKVACHQQLQPRPCCETQSSAPPSASPLFNWTTSLSVSVATLAYDFSPALFASRLLKAPAPLQAEIFLLKHSLLC